MARPTLLILCEQQRHFILDGSTKQNKGVMRHTFHPPAILMLGANLNYAGNMYDK